MQASGKLDLKEPIYRQLTAWYPPQTPEHTPYGAAADGEPEAASYPSEFAQYAAGSDFEPLAPQAHADDIPGLAQSAGLSQHIPGLPVQGGDSASMSQQLPGLGEESAGVSQLWPGVSQHIPALPLQGGESAGSQHVPPLPVQGSESAVSQHPEGSGVPAVGQAEEAVFAAMRAASKDHAIQFPTGLASGEAERTQP